MRTPGRPLSDGSLDELRATAAHYQSVEAEFEQNQQMVDFVAKVEKCQVTNFPREDQTDDDC
jgi:hypothetical protein